MSELTTYPSIQTYSGIMLDFLNPTNEMIVLEDIGRALSRVCRYGGHTRDHYSVAEHSVHIVRWLRRKTSDTFTLRQGFLHDAPEYAVGDMVKPLKNLIGTPFAEVEGRMWAVICDRFNMPLGLKPLVKEADLRILMNEKDAVFIRQVPWGWKVEPLDGVSIQFWTAEQAYQEFMSEARKLGLR